MDHHAHHPRKPCILVPFECNLLEAYNTVAMLINRSPWPFLLRLLPCHPKQREKYPEPPACPSINMVSRIYFLA